MIIEALRLLTDWMNDPVNGVNALLPSTPLDGADAVPPNLAMIVDSTRDGDAARGRLPKTLPGIAVISQPIEGLAPHVSIADCEGDVTVALRLGMTAAATESGFAASSYYLRTMLRSIRRFNSNLDSTARVRNQIYLESCSELRMVQLFDPIEDSVITGALVGTWHVRDLLPT